MSRDGPPFDTVVTVDPRLITSDRLAELSETIGALTGVDDSTHVSRYPAMVGDLQDAGIEAASVPSVARDVVRHAGGKLVPSAVDRELRLAALREIDWQGKAPEVLAKAAEGDEEAFHELGSRLLGMAAWQDIDLGERDDPLDAFGPVQHRHRRFLDALNWTPPERAIPHAREALAADPDVRKFVLGPAEGLVVWEVEELIEMGTAFFRQLGRDITTVGVYLEGASVRRPYAETHELLPTLEAAGVDVVAYEDVAGLAAPATGSTTQRVTGLGGD